MLPPWSSRATQPGASFLPEDGSRPFLWPVPGASGVSTGSHRYSHGQGPHEDPQLQARGFPRAVHTCQLARLPSHPACVSKGPHEAEPKGGFWNKVAESKVRVKGQL